MKSLIFLFYGHVLIGSEIRLASDKWIDMTNVFRLSPSRSLGKKNLY